jgi:hypothetical protein
MSDELRLPDDLAACEARLAAQSLPATAINRDELMYRAGWAACEARLAASVTSPPLKGGARGGIRLAAASFTSAAVAASLAVAITLQWQKLDSDPSVAVGAPSPPIAQALRRSSPSESEAAAESAHARFAVARGSDLELLVSRLASGDVRPGTMTAMAISGLRADLAPSGSDAVNLRTSQLSAAESKSARQLMEEILPPSNERSTKPFVPMWPWSRSQAGDSI